MTNPKRKPTSINTEIKQVFVTLGCLFGSAFLCSFFYGPFVGVALWGAVVWVLAHVPWKAL